MLSDLLSLERRTFRYKREEKGNKRTGAMCDYQTNTNIDRSRNIRPNTQTSRKNKYKHKNNYKYEYKKLKGRKR